MRRARPDMRLIYDLMRKADYGKLRGYTAEQVNFLKSQFSEFYFEYDEKEGVHIIVFPLKFIRWFEYDCWLIAAKIKESEFEEAKRIYEDMKSRYEAILDIMKIGESETCRCNDDD